MRSRSPQGPRHCEARPSMRAWPGGHAEVDGSPIRHSRVGRPSMRAWPGGHAEDAGDREAVLVLHPSMRAWPGGHAELTLLCDVLVLLSAPSMRAWPGGHAEHCCAAGVAGAVRACNEGMARRPCGVRGALVTHGHRSMSFNEGMARRPCGDCCRVRPYLQRLAPFYEGMARRPCGADWAQAELGGEWVALQ